MKSRVLLMSVVCGAALTACAGGASRRAETATPAPAGKSGGYVTSEAPSTPIDTQSEATAPGALDEAPPPSAAAGAPAPKSAQPSSRVFEQERSSRRPAEERPGLGTTWGESRASHVTTEPFFRANGDRPFAVSTFFYNDADGVRAMARRAGISDFGAGAVRVAGGGLTVRLLDSQGAPLAALDVAGRTHFVGDDGDRYTIQLQNHTGNRFEAVTTVDGLDVIDGRRGSFSKRGYLIAPFATVEIDGFRRSTQEVAAFRFGSVKNSYAARKGDDRNVGVIGVAVFHEAGSRFPWTDSEVDRRNNADPFPGQFAVPPR
jgi:hypothetical protein